MNGKTHQIVGITLGVAASTILHKTTGMSLFNAIPLIACSSAGSYIPDIDHVGSKLGKKLPILSWPISGMSKLFKFLYSKTKWKIFNHFGEMFEHRGILHAPLFWTLIFGLIFSCVLPLIVVPLAAELFTYAMIGLTVGIGGHLLADMLNPTGIPLFMPFVNKQFRFARIRTGSSSESVFLIFAVLCLFASLIGAFIIIT